MVSPTDENVFSAYKNMAKTIFSEKLLEDESVQKVYKKERS